MSITVLIAEDQRMVLGALGTLLGLEPDIDVVGSAADGDEALRLTRTLRPDVLLTDIEMPGRTGLDVAGEVRRQGLPTRVVILTTFARAGSSHGWRCSMRTSKSQPSGLSNGPWYSRACIAVLRLPVTSFTASRKFAASDAST